MKNKLLLLLIILLPAVCFAGSELAGTTSHNFLKIPPFARAAGMGESLVSISDGTYALHYNPAGIPNVMGFEAQATHIQWFQDINYEYVSIVTPFPFYNTGKLGLSFAWFQIDEMDRTSALPSYDPSDLESTDFDDYTDGTFSPFDFSLALGYGLEIEKIKGLTAGAVIKYTAQNIDESSGSNITADMGMMYKLIVNNNLLRFGTVISGLGSDLKMENTGFSPPRILKIGISDRFELFSNRMLVSGQAIIQNDYDPLFSAGVEYWIQNIVAFRAGYKFGAFNHPTMGAGIKYRGAEINYAFVRYSELGNTHRFSLLYRWGAPPSGLKVRPYVFSPNGDNFIDFTYFTPVLKAPSKVNSVEINIYDPDGSEILATIPADSPLSKKITWSGRKDNVSLSDGTYLASARAQYDSGISESPKIPVEIDNTPPRLRVDAEPKLLQPGRGESLVIPATFTFYAEDKNNVGGWQFVVWDGNRNVFFNTGGKGEPPLSYIWDGKSNDGRYVDTGEIYYYSFSAYDTLGNKAKTKPQSQVVLLKEITLTFASDALFDLGKADVKISAYSILKEMKSVLAEYPESKITVAGHTDNLKPKNSTYPTNKKLSKARAEAVKFFMVNLLNMDESRINTVGYGASKPIAANKTAAGRNKNRRVEIKIESTIYK